MKNPPILKIIPTLLFVFLLLGVMGDITSFPQRYFNVDGVVGLDIQIRVAGSFLNPNPTNTQVSPSIETDGTYRNWKNSDNTTNSLIVEFVGAVKPISVEFESTNNLFSRRQFVGGQNFTYNERADLDVVGLGTVTSTTTATPNTCGISNYTTPVAGGNGTANHSYVMPVGGNAGTTNIRNSCGFVSTFEDPAGISSFQYTYSTPVNNARPGNNTATQPGTFSFTIDNALLPVELVSFTATENGKDARLEWITASESDNSHFDIEHSIDGTTFNYLEKVDSQTKFGNSDQELLYIFYDRDASLRNKETYYRLKQVDYDGEFAYSSIQLVIFDSSSFSPKVFPNPIDKGQSLTIAYDDVISTIDIYKTSGERVKRIREIGKAKSISLPLTGLAKGLYFMVINQDKTVKFIVK